jgi:hypothetical protein
MLILQNDFFPPIFKISSSEKCTFCVISFNEMWCMNWIEEIKRNLLQKVPLHLALWCESYPTLKFNFFGQWFDHNLPTTHEKFMFLDFLERWEQDLQLSCWTKFHLKHFWTCNFKEKTFPFLAILNYKSLSIFGKFSSDFIFFILDVWNVKWNLSRHERSVSNSLPPPNPSFQAQLTTVDFSDW